MGRLSRICVTLLMAAGVIAGCADTAMRVTVHDDGSLTSHTVVTPYWESLVTFAEESGLGVIEACGRVLSDLAGDAEEGSEGDGSAGAVSGSEAPMEVVVVNDGDACSLMLTQMASPEAAISNTTELTRTEDGGWLFVMRGFEAGVEGVSELDSTLFDLLSLDLHLTFDMPGHAVSHNATKVETVTGNGETRTMFGWVLSAAELSKGVEAPFAETTGSSPEDGPGGDIPTSSTTPAGGDEADGASDVPGLPENERTGESETAEEITGTTSVSNVPAPPPTTIASAGERLSGNETQQRRAGNLADPSLPEESDGDGWNWGPWMLAALIGGVIALGVARYR